MSLTAASVASAAEVALVAGAIELRGAGGGEVCVFVDDVEGVPGVLGGFERENGVVRFLPSFGLSAGLRYRVEVGGEIVGTVVVPEVGGEAARVVGVYPSGELLPENALRFYVEFSRPMGRGFAYENLVLRGEDGEVIADPWLELGEELWDPEGRRFTLLVDPGRVKRGLVPHKEAGPVFTAGRKYTLEVAAGWKDARGKVLGEGFTKTFRTAAADSVQPDPRGWEVVAPLSGTRDPLVVRFPEALDRGLLERVVNVVGVAGNVELGGGEREWRFNPADEWSPGAYALEVGGELEDLAGNSVRKKFEVGEGDRQGLEMGGKIEIRFRVGGLPVSWDVDRGEGISWKAEVRGDGASTPVVSRGKVFVTSQIGSGPVASMRGGEAAAEESDEVLFLVVCLDRVSGDLLWEREIRSRGRLEAVHPLQNLATPTCAVAGGRVVAWFGTGQLVCLDDDGERLWERHLGEEVHEFRLKWGHSSSPVVDEEKVYLLCDHDPGACLLVLDVETGEELWRVARGKGLRSYSTPVIADVGGRRQVIVNSNPGIEGYDSVTGELIWNWKEFCKVPVPVPTVSGGVMTASRGYGNGPLMVLDLDGASGEVETDAVEWRWAGRAPYVSSPLVAGDQLYLANEGGQVYCVDAKTGEVDWVEKLGTCFWATPVRGGGKIYLLDESGEVLVLGDGRGPEVMARNRMPGEARGSMVIDGGQLLVRTTEGLFCVGK